MGIKNRHRPHTKLFRVISIFRFLNQDLRIDNCSKSYTILIDDFDLEGKLVNLVRHYARFITDFWPKRELFMWDLADTYDSPDNFH